MSATQNMCLLGMAFEKVSLDIQRPGICKRLPQALRVGYTRGPMSMMRFGSFFPELAARETRTATVIDPLPPEHPSYLPPDEYGFDEWYCVDPKCDCQRVMFNVYARRAQAHLATISHAFRPPDDNAIVPEQTFLDPVNRQSRWSKAILRLFVNEVIVDEAYRQRLERHYQMVKKAIADPGHPCQRIIRKSGLPGGGFSSKPKRSLPPGRRSKKRR